MELLNLLVRPIHTSNICFLCFKKSLETTSLFDMIELHDEFFDLNITLLDIMNNLLPSHETLLKQACDSCANLLIKLYSLLQRNYFRTEMLSKIIDNINEEVDQSQSKAKSKVLMIKVNLPTIENLFENYRPILAEIDCNKCRMKFKSEKLLKNHIRIAHKNSNNAVICDICAKTFKKSSALKAHLSCHRQKTCPICSKVLKSNSHFNLHLKNHNTPVKRKRNVKFYSCSFCDYKSVQKSSLAAHVNKSHLNVRPFICSLCERGFYKKSNLVEHLETHKKVKNHICEVCGDSFVCKKTLNEHLRLHEGVKKYKCNVCGLGFINSGRRLEHIKRKHMVKAENCVICTKKFSLKKDLKLHLKKVHGVVDQV